MPEDEKKQEPDDGIDFRGPFGFWLRISGKTMSSELVVRYFVAPFAILLGITATLWGIAQVVAAWKGSTP